MTLIYFINDTSISAYKEFNVILIDSLHFLCGRGSIHSHNFPREKNLFDHLNNSLSRTVFQGSFRIFLNKTGINHD